MIIIVVVVVVVVVVGIGYITPYQPMDVPCLIVSTTTATTTTTNTNNNKYYQNHSPVHGHPVPQGSGGGGEPLPAVLEEVLQSNQTRSHHQSPTPVAIVVVMVEG